MLVQWNFGAVLMTPPVTVRPALGGFDLLGLLGAAGAWRRAAEHPARCLDGVELACAAQEAVSRRPAGRGGELVCERAADYLCRRQIPRNRAAFIAA